jgi:hypothetical protein
MIPFGLVSMGLLFTELSTAYQEGHGDTATFIGMARVEAIGFRGRHVPHGVSIQIQNVSSLLGVLHCHALEGGILLP